MTRTEILALVRKLIADEQSTGFTEGGNLEQPEGTQELLNYLDRAVDEYSKRQAASADVRLVKRLTVTNGMNLPDDFISFCGAVPLNIEGKSILVYSTVPELPVRYFARLPYVTSFATDDTQMSYDNDQCIIIAALAAIYALNKHEYDISQDLLLMGYGASKNGSAQ